MILKSPLQCVCKECNQGFVKLRKRGYLDICKTCHSKARVKKWKLDNPARKLALNQRWSELNREKDRAMKKKWQDANPAYGRAKTSKYLAKKRQALPAWADLEKIKDIYLHCPVGHHVDHIVPLQGKIVSGLNIETNLQYLPAFDNRSKSNFFEGNP